LALQNAIRHHQAGELRQAEQIYRQILTRDPSLPDPWHLLGVLARQCGRAAEAVRLIERALQLAPEHPVLYYNLAQSLMSAGRTNEAVRAYRRAIELNPDFSEAWKNLGVAYEGCGDLESALECFEQGCRICPSSADAHCDLANSLTKLRRFDAAIATARRALLLDPNLVRAGNQLGIALRESGRLPEAEVAWRASLDRHGDDAAVLLNLGRLLHDTERVDEAIGMFERALSAVPESYEGLVNLGAALKDHGAHDRAIAVLTRATQLRPDRCEAWVDLGKVHEEIGELQLALRFFDAGLQRSPGNPEIRLNRAFALLQLGQFESGWHEYEARWQTSDAPRRPKVLLAEWTGELVAGTRVLVWGEQGIGDEIMFVSCLGDLLRQGLRVTLVAERRLVSLFARSFPGAYVVAPPESDEEWQSLADLADYQVPAGSLPRWLRRSAGDFPRAERFLMADERKTTKWRERYRELGPLPTIGIAWRAGTTVKTRRHRSAAIAEWEPLLATRHAQFVSLQYGATTEELTGFRMGHANVHSWPDADPLWDLDEFAAQVAALDLVISVGNATVHMAGALGVPCWVLLPRYWGWRWGVDRSDSVWYRSLHLFRQRTAGEWRPLFAEVAHRLEAALSGCAGGMGLRELANCSTP
jgi:tetratricopeptide (TPR) repeat protein